jgi:hypothetical protein
MAELEDATELRRGRPLGLSMVWEEGGAAACEGRRSADLAKEEGRKGKEGTRLGELTRPIGPDRSTGPDGRWAGGKKKENRFLFQN